MSDGMTEMYRKEEMERKKKVQSLKERFAKILDDYKWVICEELADNVNPNQYEDDRNY